jgi:general secretion pathway protein G
MKGMQDRERQRRSAAAGFTLLEIMIVASILAIVASIGVPNYLAALRTARIGKCRHDLITISNQIDAFAAKHGGNLPLTLYQVGFGGKRDPWGVPYCYLNYTDGTGDGLEWAVAAGLVDPSAFQGSAQGESPRLGSFFGALWPQGGGDGMLGGFTVTAVDHGDSRRLAESLVSDLARDLSIPELEALTSAIALSPGFALFTGVDAETTRRRDRYMFPLNTDYDLFSLGPDGRTSVSLGESVGLDDVIRANNGGYFGLAANY